MTEDAGEIARPAAGYFDDIQLVHEALPGIDAADVELGTVFLGKTLRLPLVISGMAGRHGRALAVNETLTRGAAKSGIAIAGATAPGGFVIAEVEMTQLLPAEDEPPPTLEQIRALVVDARADALALRLSYLEESVRPGSHPRASGAEAAIRRLVRASPVPVIATESRGGVSRPTALRLRRLGVKAIDVGGAEAAAIEIDGISASERAEATRMSLGERFRDWGLPVTVALVGASAARLPLIAGGVRSGLDAAKALALGATIVGVGRPLLQTALQGERACMDWLASFELELRTAVFLSGLKRASDLGRAPVVITGRTRTWLDQLAYRRTTTASRTARPS